MSQVIFYVKVDNLFQNILLALVGGSYKEVQEGLNLKG